MRKLHLPSPKSSRGLQSSSSVPPSPSPVDGGDGSSGRVRRRSPPTFGRRRKQIGKSYSGLADAAELHSSGPINISKPSETSALTPQSQSLSHLKSGSSNDANPGRGTHRTPIQQTGSSGRCVASPIVGAVQDLVPNALSFQQGMDGKPSADFGLAYQNSLIVSSPEEDSSPEKTQHRQEQEERELLTVVPSMSQHMAHYSSPLSNSKSHRRSSSVSRHQRMAEEGLVKGDRKNRQYSANGSDSLKIGGGKLQGNNVNFEQDFTNGAHFSRSFSDVDERQRGSGEIDDSAAWMSTIVSASISPTKGDDTSGNVNITSNIKTKKSTSRRKQKKISGVDLREREDPMGGEQFRGRPGVVNPSSSGDLPPVHSNTSRSRSVTNRNRASKSHGIAGANSSTTRTPTTPQAPRHRSRSVPSSPRVKKGEKNILAQESQLTMAATSSTARRNHHQTVPPGAKSSKGRPSKAKTSGTNSQATVTPSTKVSKGVQLSSAAESAARAAENIAARERRAKKAAAVAAKKRIFQDPDHIMGLSVATVNLRSRRLFDDAGIVVVPPALVALDMKKNGKDQHKKYSPALGHAQVLDRLIRHDFVRQLEWSFGVSPEVDPWFRSYDDSEDRKEDDENEGGKKVETRPRRGGTYVPIKLQEHMSSLPPNPPRLTNKRLRLPMRSDVGFPRATDDEVRLKQDEIQMEAELEEACPRLAVMVSGSDVGAVMGGGVGRSSNGLSFFSNSVMAGDNVGAGLAKTESSLRRGIGARKRPPDQASIFAPPLDSRPPSSKDDNNRWRPRYASDRPPGRSYLVASPIDLRFDVGDIEPLVCTLALYCLPEFATGAVKNQDIEDEQLRQQGQRLLKHRGKISEDFAFAAGDWDGQAPSVEIFSSRSTSPKSVQESVSASTFDIEVNYAAKGGSGRSMKPTPEKDSRTSRSLLSPYMAASDQGWRRWKRKALFSFDSFLLPENTPGMGCYESLFVVLQVNTVTHAGAIRPYVDSGDDVAAVQSSSCVAKARKPKSIKGLGRKLGIGKGSSTSQSSCVIDEPDNNAAASTRRRAASAHESFGTQFLTPVCFGVVPAFRGYAHDAVGGKDGSYLHGMEWPESAIQDVELFAFPNHPDTQEAFVDRLASVVRSRLSRPESGFSAEKQNANEDNLCSIVNAPHSSAGTVPSSQGKYKLKHNANDNAGGSGTDPADNVRVAGSGTLLTSFLGSDPGRILRRKYPEAITSPDPSCVPSSERTRPSRLLVDASGDCAVAVDEEQQEGSTSPKTHGKNKKLKVAALPTSTRPAGYADSFDFREILFLPATQRDEIGRRPFAPLFPRSFLNLLYLYPRMLSPVEPEEIHNRRERFGEMNGHSKFYSVRIRLIHEPSKADTGIVSPSETSPQSTIMDAVYNPAPCGRPLLKAFYTKIPHSLSTKRLHGRHHYQSGAAEKNGFPLRDEVKLRLPTVLDGSYYLHFSLFSIELTDSSEADGVVAEMLSETKIPLSNNATKEPGSGVRVTTIIPDDVHRIKLGTFLLHVETRLVSSIHVSDPSVATFMRDFPFSKGIDHNGIIPSCYGEGHITVTGPSGRRSFFLGNCSFSTILSKASEQVLANHAHVLLFMHFSNLINNGSPAFDFGRVAKLFGQSDDDMDHGESPLSSGLALMEENLTSLVELIRKIKLKFWSDEHLNEAPIYNGRSFSSFLKYFVDLFDEKLFLIQLRDRSHNSDLLDSPSVLFEERERSNSSISSDGGNSQSHFLSSGDAVREQVMGRMEEKSSKVPSKLVAQQHQHRKIRRDVELLRSASSGSHIDAPFSRRAYGVSKIDRMRAEAEFEVDVRGRADLLDDDQTVFTAATWHDRRQRNESTNFDPSFVDNSSTSNQTAARRKQDGEEGVQARGGLPKASLYRGSSDGSVSSFNDRAKAIREKLPTMPGLGGDYNLTKRVNSMAKIFMAPCMAPPVDADVHKGPGLVPAFDVKANIGLLQESGRARQKVTMEKIKRTVDLPKTCSPGSDVEDETDDGMNEWVQRRSTTGTKAKEWTYLSEHKTKLRGDRLILEQIGPIEFSFPKMSNSASVAVKGRPFVYESIFAVWIQAWMDDNSSEREEIDGNRSEGNIQDSFPGKSSCHPLLPQSKLSHSFLVHVDFILPICLKSLALRCSERTATVAVRENGKIPLCVLDSLHMQLLVPLVGVWAQGLMKQALEAPDSEVEKDSSLLGTINMSSTVLDFFIALLAIIHVSQVSVLIENYIEILRGSETESEESQGKPSSSKRISANQVRRMRCSRHLRLHAIEKLAAVPSFVALNYPLKYPSIGRRSTRKDATWTHQILDDSSEIPESSVICPFPDGFDRVPKSHWLAELLTNECFSICSSSCETILAETVQQERPPVLSRRDLRRFQSIAIDGVACLYEMLMRRHSIDSRFQSDEGRSRTAAMFVRVIFRNSLESVHWLSRMEATHKVRVFWLLSLLHILQEAPEFLIREQLRLFCNEKNFMLHKFVRLLKLCNSTFQGFIGSPKGHNVHPSLYFSENLAPWVVQESFNIICAATNMLVDECCDAMLSMPLERKRLAQGLLNLLLHVMTTPQSAVTHLRAIGGASQALDKFGAGLFLEAVGDSLQHWARMVLTLMNSTALSVRSIAVDFIVSLLGGVYNEKGTIDEITLVILSVMPEVVAREIGMYCASDRIATMADVECGMWPLRRALADVEDADPEDDDRVDPQLAPFLATFCRSCQAVIDGVLIELRLEGAKCKIVGTQIHGWNGQGVSNSKPDEHGNGNDFASGSTFWGHSFDADEESIYEAANSFLPETAPLQRLRWLLTLKSLHVAKGQWVEAAETLLLSARTIADAIPHIKHVWRPSRFLLWNDARLSLWLPTVGADSELKEKKNVQVMEFADKFLEPSDLMAGITSLKPHSDDGGGKLHQPTVSILCRLVAKLSKSAVMNYLKEEGVESVAFLRLEELLKNVMGVVEHYSTINSSGSYGLLGDTGSNQKELVEENAALRRMSASLNFDMTKVAERMLLHADEADENDESRGLNFVRRREGRTNSKQERVRQFYVRVLLLGNKPDRFKESTTLPTFLEWGSPSICRVPMKAVVQSLSQVSKHSSKTDVASSSLAEEHICAAFAEPLLAALYMEKPAESVTFCMQPPSDDVLNSEGEKKTFVVVTLVRTVGDEAISIGAKRFFYRSQVQAPAISLREEASSAKSAKSFIAGYVESTVAQRFPCALSRQRSIITSEFVSGSADFTGHPLYQF